jgi:hypothetical protein
MNTTSIRPIKKESQLMPAFHSLGSKSNLSVEMVRNESGFKMKSKGGNRWTEEAIKSAALADNGPLKFTISWKSPNPIRHKIAMLHSAHLCLFRDFGYELLLSGTEWVRGILTADPPEKMPEFFTLHVPKDMPGIGSDVLYRSGVALVDGVRCFVAMFPSPDAKTALRCVMLPGPGEEQAAAYWKLAEAPDQVRNVQFSLCAYDAYPRLTKREDMDYLRYLSSNGFPNEAGGST